MAQKISRPRKAAPPPAKDAAEELDVLHPDRPLRVGALALVVREYRHLEWLRLLPVAAPVVDALASLLEAGREPSYEEALAAIAANADSLMPLVAQACDMSLGDLDGLNPEEGELLLMTWWGVNGRFFIGRAVNRVAVARAAQRARSAGGSSTPSSSPTDTTGTGSPATPPAS